MVCTYVSLVSYFASRRLFTSGREEPRLFDLFVRLFVLTCYLQLCGVKWVSIGSVFCWPTLFTVCVCINARALAILGSKTLRSVCLCAHIECRLPIVMILRRHMILSALVVYWLPRIWEFVSAKVYLLRLFLNSHKNNDNNQQQSVTHVSKWYLIVSTEANRLVITIHDASNKVQYVWQTFQIVISDLIGVRKFLTIANITYLYRNLYRYSDNLAALGQGGAGLVGVSKYLTFSKLYQTKAHRQAYLGTYCKRSGGGVAWGLKVASGGSPE